MKKLLAVFVAVAILATCSLTFCSAATTDRFTVTMKSSATTVVAGQKGVTLNLNITKNPGIWGFQFIVKYNPSIFEFVSNTNSEACGLAGLGALDPNCDTKAGTVIYNVTYNSISANSTYTGSFATLKFNVKTTAKTGSYPFTISSPTPGSFMINYKSQDVPYTFSGCTVKVAPKATGLSLNKTKAEVVAKQPLQLTGTVTPTGAITKLNWTTSDKTVATVDTNGLVKAVGYGKATITATTTDGSNLKKTCLIQTRFRDVNGSNDRTKSNYQYFWDPVYWAADQGITKGYTASGDFYFGPKQNCKRFEMMIFLWRASGRPGEKTDKTSSYGDARKMFKDITDGPTTDTNKAIAWGYKNGIVKGYADGTFGRDKSIIRKDTLIMLYRVAKKPAVSGKLTFKDVSTKTYPTTGDTYKAILWGSKLGITGGYSDGTFKPLDNCLREHIVTFLYRFKQKV